MTSQKPRIKTGLYSVLVALLLIATIFLASSIDPTNAQPLETAEVSEMGKTAVGTQFLTAPAALFPHRYCYNWDLFPPPDQPVNDLHITLLGPTSITDEYIGPMNPFGPAQQMYDPVTGTLSLWYQYFGILDPAIPVHIGFCTDKPIFWTVPDPQGLPPHYWTLDGNPVFPTIPMPGIDWWWLPEPDHWQIGLFNHDNLIGPNIDTVAAGGIDLLGMEVAVVDIPFTLNDLVWDNPDIQALPWQPVVAQPHTIQYNIDSFFDVFYEIEVGQYALMRAITADPTTPNNEVRILSQALFEPPPPPIYCYNWDLVNNTGQLANDLHLGLKGPRVLSQVYMHSQFGAPDPRSGYDPALDIYELIFSGAIIAPGEIVHIGFCTDQPLVEFVGFPGLPPHYWTWDGEPIPGPIPLPGIDWWWLNDGNWQLGFMNSAEQGDPLVVETLEMVVVPNPIPLDGLLWDDLDGLPWIPAELPPPLPPGGPGVPPILVPPPMGPPWGVQPGDTILTRMSVIWDGSGAVGTRLITQAIVPPPPRYCYNWDFYNWTGFDVNDLHIDLLGPTTLTSVYTGASNPFGPPDGSSGFDPATGIYSLNFSGGIVPPGGLAHIGFCSDKPVMRTIGDDGLPPFYWTMDGMPVDDPIPLPGWDWWWLQDGADIGIFNDTGVDIIINSVEVAQLPDETPPIMLNDLLWDPPGVPLNWVPVAGGEPLPVGAESFFDVFFDIEPGDSVLGRIEVADANDPNNVTRLITQGEFWPPPPPIYCYNWDFFNNHPFPVNDLHIGLKGIRELSDVYMGPLNPFGAPHPMSGYDPALDAYFLWYDGAEVPPGGLVHIGFCTDQPLVEIPGFEGLPPFYWTIDGQPLPDPDIPLPGFDWWWLGDGNLQFGLINGGIDPLLIVPGSLQMATIPAPIPLDDLTWDQVDIHIDSFFDVFTEVEIIPPGEDILIDVPNLPVPGTSIVARLLVDDPDGSSQPTRILAQAVVPPPPRYCYNWDFYNHTGHRANDLHIGLLGPTVLTNVYTGPLNPFGPPDGSSGYDPATGVYSLNFSGGIVDPGGFAHIGFCTDKPVMRTIGADGLPPFYWTWNGEPLPGSPPLPGWDWWWLRDGADIGIFNDTGVDIIINSVEVAQLPDETPPIMLNDLLWDPPGVPLNWVPVAGGESLPIGAESFFDVFFDIEPGDSVLGRIEVADANDPNNVTRLITQGEFWPPPPPIYCYNWDFFNNHPFPVNDLHIGLKGIRELSDVYMGPLNPFGAPHPMSGYDPALDAYFLWYDGAEVPPGGLVHIGFCTDQPLVEIPGFEGLPPFYWTIDGQPLPDPDIPLPGFDWWWLGDGRLQFGLINGGIDPLRLIPNSLQMATIPAPIPLDDLTWDQVDIHIDSFFDVFTEVEIIPPGEDVLIDVPEPPEPGTTIVARLLVDDPDGSSQPTRILAQAVVPPPPRYCYNWDFYNHTGQRANDLHIGLLGPTVLTNVYTGPLNPFGPPDGSSGYDPATNVYSLNFSGGIVDPGGFAHIGFCSDRPVFRIRGENGLPPFYWTWNGEPLPGNPPLPGWDWWWVGGNPNGFELGLFNDSSDGVPIEIVALSLRDPGGVPLMLNELTTDIVQTMPEIWHGGPPVTIPPGGEHFFDVVLPMDLEQDMPLIGMATVLDPHDPTGQTATTLISQALVDLPPRPDYCYNWDFFNTTNEVANDLHIALSGPTALADIYMGVLNPFGSPHPLSGYDPTTGLYLLWYDGAEVPPGGLVHIGFCSDKPVLIPAEDPNHPGLPPHFWTRDGVPIGDPIPLPGWDWWWHHEEAGGFEIVLTNPNPLPITAVLVEVAATNTHIPLENLVTGHPDLSGLSFEPVGAGLLLDALGPPIHIPVPFGVGNIPPEPTDFYVGHVVITDPTGQQVLNLWTQGRWLPPAISSIPLDSGWNMISSYVEPQDPAMEAIFAQPAGNNLILCKDGLGQVYWPDYSINDIGDWDVQNGYQCYMSSGDTLDIIGHKVIPELTPLSLADGWSLIAYLRDAPIPVEAGLGTIGNEILLAKNGSGEVYWPAYGINQIGEMLPGQGYQVDLTIPGTLTYPDN